MNTRMGGCLRTEPTHLTMTYRNLLAQSYVGNSANMVLLVAAYSEGHS